MIKILFPEGCYGTYLTRCVYNFSNLRKTKFVDFTFKHGNSHDHWHDRDAPKVIRQGHLPKLSISEGDQVILMVPTPGHFLDYYNNQYYKGSGDIIKHLRSQVTIYEANTKLKTFWNYDGAFDHNVPKWILREWCSFWIQDALNETYANLENYNKVNFLYKISTQDLFEDFIRHLDQIFVVLGLTFSVDKNIIYTQHQRFLAEQKFHNSEILCKRVVDQALAGEDVGIHIQSIFDEAYIQHLLRQNGLELECNGLNIFPKTTKHLIELTYEASQNNNTR